MVQKWRAFWLCLIFSAVFSLSIASQDDCSYTYDNYHLSWWTGRGQVYFDLVYNNIPKGENVWTGVGFGEDMASGLDVIVVRVVNGKITCSDEYVQGYRSPLRDASQDVTVQSSSLSNGKLHVSFSRPLKATEPDHDYALDHGCAPFKFVYGLGPAHGPSGQVIGHHSQTPGSATVCLERCHKKYK